MKHLNLISIVLIMLFSYLPSMGQKQCGNNETYKLMMQQHPEVYSKLYSGFNLRDDENTVYTIPVVVHVVWNTGFENIPDSAIYRQIEELNRFYSGNPLYANHIPFAFSGVYAGNTKIKFELAKQDANGKPTNGITRTQTCHGPFVDAAVQTDCMEIDVKKTATGGIDAWDTEKYLNIWVCDYQSANGVAVFPGTCSSSTGFDGIVIRFGLFGSVNTNLSITGGVSTTAHEAGHYLGLFHIWGDEPACVDDDAIGDTPWQSDDAITITSSTGTNTIPLYDACSTAPGNGIMHMNLLDYNSDVSRMMLTVNQKTVCRNTLKPGGARNSLVDAANTALQASTFNANKNFKVWNTGFSTNSFRSIASGKEGEMWAGTTSNGLYRYNDATETWDQETTTTSHITRHIISDNDGNIFVASSQLTNSASGGIRRFGTAGSFSFTKIGSIEDVTGAFSPLPSRLVNGLSIDDEGDVWAACGQHISPNGPIFEGGICYVDNGMILYSNALSAGDAGMPAEDVRCFAVESVLDGPTDTDDEIWVSVDRSCISGTCTAPYVARYNTTLGVFSYLGNVSLPGVNFDNTPGSPKVRAIHCDKAGRVWLGIGTAQHGLFVKYPSTCGNANYFTFSDVTSPFPAGATVNNNAITEDSDGNIWIGTSAGLIKIEGGNIQNTTKWTIYTTTNGLPSNNIRSICFDANNTIWCTTDAGVFRGLPCPGVSIKSVTNPSCFLGGGNILTEFKGGDFSNIAYTWEKLNSSSTYEVLPFVDPQLNMTEPGNYRVTVKVGAQQCYQRKIDVRANDFYIPEVTVSKITACGFEANITNGTNDVFYNVDVYNNNTNSIVYSELSTINGSNIISNSTNILPSTDYYIMITGQCSNDESGTFQTISRKSNTFATVACSRVKDIVATNITKTSATISWNFNCVAANKYRLEYKKSTEPIASYQLITTSNLSKTLTGLDPSTTYDVRVRAVCTPNGASVSSWESIQFNTLQGCIKPDNIQVSGTTGNTATITWSAVPDINQYRIRYRKLGTTTWTNIAVAAPSTSKTLTGLSPNSTYEFQMRSKCNTNNEFSVYTAMNGFLTTLRMSEEQLAQNIILYPNPTQGLFTISIFSETQSELEIHIINTLGQIVLFKKVSLDSGENNIYVDDVIPVGYYNIQFKAENYNINKQLIIQR